MGRFRTSEGEKWKDDREPEHKGATPSPAREEFSILSARAVSEQALSPESLRKHNASEPFSIFNPTKRIKPIPELYSTIFSTTKKMQGNFSLSPRFLQ